MRDLENISKSSTVGVQFWGDADTFKLISKASSKKELWMKSTKAMEIEGVGCVVQVTTQQGTSTGNNPHRFDEEGREIITKGGYTQIAIGESSISWSVAEAITFVPGVKIQETRDTSDTVTSRRLIKI